MSARHPGRVALVVGLLAAGVAPPAIAQTPTGRVQGTVVDSRTQRPVQAASVFIQGLNLGTQTNERGTYVLVNVPAGAHAVQVRRIGFATARQTVTVPANATATADFRLNEAALSLDEVVVTGTALATRAKEVPTSTAILNSDEFARAPVINAQQVIAGRVPSVAVLANSGQVGAGGTIKIRGTNTVSQSTDPLIYIDGVRVFNEMSRGPWGSHTGTNPLQDINPDDIEHIEIVKGAAATTLYGTEAAAGVIQIFTHKGSATAPAWDVNLTGGYNVSPRWGAKDDPTELFINCGEHDLMYGLKTSGKTVGSRVYFQDPTCPSSGKWTRPGPVRQSDVAVHGGNEKVTYYLSGNYADRNGILQTQRSRDGGFRGNFAFYPLDKLQFSLNTSYVRRNTNWVGDGNRANGFLLNVGRGPYNYFKGGKGDDCAGVADSIVCITNKYIFDQDIRTANNHFLSAVTANYTPTEHLSNRFSVGWDYFDTEDVTHVPFGFIRTPTGYYYDENTNHHKLSLDYAGSFSNKLLGLASAFSWGGQLFRDHHRWTEFDVENFAGPGEPTLKTGAELTYREDLPTSITNAGFFLQEQVSWQDRLFVTGGMRVDGNSAFGENFGLQKYPKVGVAYVLSDHDFWPKDWWDQFKLRLAYGQSGKAPGAFDKLRTWRPVTGDENKPGFTPNDVGNADIGPERTAELEGGFDASFLGGRLGAEVTGYRDRTFQAIVPVELPPSNGFLVSQKQNVGELRNAGLELQLNAQLVRTQRVGWSARATMSRLKSKAIDLGPQPEVYTGLNSFIKKNAAFPAYYGKKVLNPDANDDPQISSDTALIGLVNPDRMWGLGTTVTLMTNVTLDAFVEHQGGFFVQNYTAYQDARRGVWVPCYGAEEKMVASWGVDKKAGTADDDPSQLDGVSALDRARCRFSGNDIGFWTEPGDFTKLRYVSLTWDIPQRFVPQANHASVTVSGRNLFTWSNYHGGDPEMQDVGDQANLVGTDGRFGRRDYYQIPQSKAFTMSLRVTF